MDKRNRIFILLIIAAAAAVLSSALLSRMDNGNGMQMTQMEEINGKLTPIPAGELPDPRARTNYEIFVYSFCDSNGDGIGDLRGVIDRLDYINNGDPGSDASLGCTGIWLMPVFPSPTYHKYDVTDYTDIDPAYGTMEDMDSLIAACHERDIRLIIDLPVNHTSVEHPWFAGAAEYLRTHGDAAAKALAGGPEEMAALTAECPYLDYYHFSTEKQQGYEPLPGTDFYYEARFWSGMPDLDLDSEAVRQELAGIVRFWLERGIDGFRLDAVGYFYSDDSSRSIAFLQWLNETAKAVSPEAYLVGEVWENQEIYARYYASGVDSLFDFAFAGPDGRIAKTVKGGRSALAFAEDMAAAEELYAGYGDRAVNAPFYTNHDMARSTGYYAYDDGSRTKLSGALNLLMSGSAFVYYGEETGLKGSGKDENKRAPMPWGEGAEGVCAGPPGMDPQEAKFGTVAEQEKDPYSVLNYYRNAIRVRSAFPAIACGRTRVLEELSDRDVGAFIRSADGADPVLIVFNTSEESRQADLSGLGFGQLSAVLTVSGEEVVYRDNSLTLPPFGVAVLTQAP